MATNYVVLIIYTESKQELYMKLNIHENVGGFGFTDSKILKELS